MAIDLLDRAVTARVAVGILPERRDDDVFGRIEADDAVDFERTVQEIEDVFAAAAIERLVPTPGEKAIGLYRRR